MLPVLTCSLSLLPPSEMDWSLNFTLASTTLDPRDSRDTCINLFNQDVGLHTFAMDTDEDQTYLQNKTQLIALSWRHTVLITVKSSLWFCDEYMFEVFRAARVYTGCVRFKLLVIYAVLIAVQLLSMMSIFITCSMTWNKFVTNQRAALDVCTGWVRARLVCAHMRSNFILCGRTHGAPT